MFKFTVLIIGLLVLNACASVPVIDSDAAMKISKIKVIKPAEAVLYDYDTIQSVEGLSCRTDFNSTPPTYNEALNDVKIQAGNLGANAIILTSCKNTGSQLLKFCDYSLTCTGSAITIKKDKLNQCRNDMANSPSLSLIKQKVPLKLKKPSFSMLSDKSSPLTAEKGVLREWGAMIDNCHRIRTKLIQDLVPLEALNMREESYLEQQTALIGLINGKITYSKFAEKIATINANFLKNYALLSKKQQEVSSQAHRQSIRANQAQQRINLERRKIQNAARIEANKIIMNQFVKPSEKTSSGSTMESLNCGIKPIPSIGYRIGRCVNGRWEMVSD